MMNKQAIVLGAFFAGIAVILGAFGAHALKAVMTPDKLLVFETGVRYHFYHSFASMLAGILYCSFPTKKLKLSVSFFITGILLFSGSLYAISLLSISGGTIGPLGILTPIGGVFFILGWAMIVAGVATHKPMKG
jgi:uncharacterized membrane protein YgdD (TMEM256/DUF423 family)